MNRGELIRHLLANGCSLAREGKKHSLYRNDSHPEHISAVPRHSPLKMNTALKICRELNIPKPGSR